MATTLPSDMKVYDPRARGGFTERLLQNLAVFNQASNGTMVLASNRQAGNFSYESMFKMAGGLITRRDETSLAAATAKKLSQDEFITVKVNRKVGPVEWTLASFKKAGYNESTFRFVAGQEAADAFLQDQVHSSLVSVTAALNGFASVKHEVKNSGGNFIKMASTDLVDGLNKFGDQAQQIRAWVMHSKTYNDLVKDQINMKVTGISNLSLAGATPITLNRPVLVTDDPALIVNDAPPSQTAAYRYLTLGLTANAVTCEDSEEETMLFETITGLENIVIRMQGEMAYNLGMKAHKWDVANGGANPTEAALGTATNWDRVLTDPKQMPGVIIKSL